MKQKNLILMVVAVGCGLVAAFLTSQMSAKPKGDSVEMVDVIVATKELAPGTRFTKDSLKDQVKRKKYKRGEEPDRAVTAEDQLIDKQLTKTLRADDYVSEGDLGEYRPLQPPTGKDLIALRLPVDKVTPFVKPGSRIDLIGTGVTRAQKVVGMMVLPNVLVMAVDLEVKPENQFGGKSNIQLTTLAVNAEEALLIRMCETANVQLSYILRSEGEDGNQNPLQAGWSKEKVKQWLQDQQEHNTGLPGRNDGGQDTPKPAESAKVKLPVPTEDLQPGTEVTAELIEKKFKDVEFVAPAPENAVKDMKEHLGRYVVEKVFANQFVPRTAVGNKPEPKKPATETAPAPAPAPAPKAEAKPKDTFDRSITHGAQTRVYRYQKQESGEWKLIGEVKEDGTVVPVQGTAPPGKPTERTAPDGLKLS